MEEAYDGWQFDELFSRVRDIEKKMEVVEQKLNTPQPEMTKEEYTNQFRAFLYSLEE